MKELNLNNIPLEGMNLIEASAGTGKTYTISKLFLRLILEKRFEIKEILVVTFTEAAVKELRMRLRKSIKEALSMFTAYDKFSNSQDKKITDQFLLNIYSKVNHQDAVMVLKKALSNFDEASIYTIHAFCQHTLMEKAFESKTLFDTELITNNEVIINEIAEDFWRINIYTAPSLLVKHIINKKYSPLVFAYFVKIVSSNPKIKFVPKQNKSDEDINTVINNILNDLKVHWDKENLAIRNIFNDIAKLKINRKSIYWKLDINKAMDEMDHFVNTDISKKEFFENFDLFTQKEILKVTSGKLESVNGIKTFELCDRLIIAIDDNILLLKHKLINYAKKELPKRKFLNNIQFFDDLLINVYNNVKYENSELAKSLKSKYKAALIDEFQDTDPIQFQIFNSIFNQNKSFFLIGDPKQSIYSFRNADIFSYINTAKKIENDKKFTLLTNHRSKPNLVKALNTFFNKDKLPFLYEDIKFNPVKSMGDTKDEVGCPLTIWYDNSKEEYPMKKPISKVAAKEKIGNALVFEIKKLLKSQKINGKNIIPSDIAILVRTNKEATFVHEKLVGANIHSTVAGGDNLFDSDEVSEIALIMDAMINPNNIRKIKTAICTDIVGMDAAEINLIDRDEDKRNYWLSVFSSCNTIWERAGFLTAFMEFFNRNKLVVNIVKQGSHKLTNIMHICEILHTISNKENLGMNALVKRLYDMIDKNSPRIQEYETRMESDRDAVVITTIHKSKGLQYPIVFSPFLLGNSTINKNNNGFFFHKEDNAIYYDLENSDNNLKLAQNEKLAENIRLLYVSFTRAIYKCYTFWGTVRDAQTSPMAYLLYYDYNKKSLDNVLDDMATQIISLTKSEMMEKLKRLEVESEGNISITPIPKDDTEEKEVISKINTGKLDVVSFSGNTATNFKISSYSSLISGKYTEDIQDRDSLINMQLNVPDVEQKMSEAKDIFTFPKGVLAGNFFHDILENIDYSQNYWESSKNIISGKLEEYGFEDKWYDVICNTIKNILHTPFINGGTLSDISKLQRVNEMEFYFPLDNLSLKKLMEFSLVGKNSRKLTLIDTKGFMKGFIDLIFEMDNKFYILDWKSNYLGDKLEDYTVDKLETVMQKELYVLQYYIYTLAVNQYLSKKISDYDYDTHFGGVYYLFLRGVGSNSGIFFDKPPKKLVEMFKLIS